MKFAFIHAEKASFPVVALCRVLGVTRQGYYAYASRKPSERQARDAALRERLRVLHAENRGTYGSPRMHELFALRACGWASAASSRRCAVWAFLPVCDGAFG